MIRVDEEDFEAVRHLLPESVLALITIIGLTETVELVKNLGGTTYPLRQGRTKGSESRLAYLEEIVGGAAMEKWWKHWPPAICLSRNANRLCWNCATAISAAASTRRRVKAYRLMRR